MLPKLRRCCFHTSTTFGRRGVTAAAAMWVVGPAPSLALLLLSSSVSKRPSSGGGLLFQSRRWSTFAGVRADEREHTGTTSTARSKLLPHLSQVRCYSSKKRQHDDAGDAADCSKSSAEQHQLFLEQLSELNQERETLFGQSTTTTNASDDGRIVDYNDNDDIQVTAERVIREVSSWQSSIIKTGVHDSNDDTDDDENNETTAAKEMEALKNERQELYGFTEEEEVSWGSAGGTHRYAVDFLQEIEQARRDMDQTLTAQQPQPQPSSAQASTTITCQSRENKTPSLPTKKLTHVADDGQSVHMVDVGAKEATRRTATAETIVVFPDEVLEAFGGQHPSDTSSDHHKCELIGPKGPIFSTAILAGIMAAKQTSNLIPLCHPLPLEQVTIDIAWRSRNTIAIQCCCHVTHKTGVEMEALTGATIAALTVYDMVKAVSHNVEIQQTRLLHKDGGKRSVDKRQT